MNKPYQIQLTPEKTLKHLTRIASGLLASGHFTREHDSEDLFGNEQLLLCQRRDNDGKLEDCSIAVVDAAAHLLFNLMNSVEGEIREGDTNRYILPDDTLERRAAWLANPVERQPEK